MAYLFATTRELESIPSEEVELSYYFNHTNHPYPRCVSIGGIPISYSRNSNPRIRDYIATKRFLFDYNNTDLILRSVRHQMHAIVCLIRTVHHEGEIRIRGRVVCGQFRVRQATLFFCPSWVWLKGFDSLSRRSRKRLKRLIERAGNCYNTTFNSSQPLYMNMRTELKVTP